MRLPVIRKKKKIRTENLMCRKWGKGTENGTMASLDPAPQSRALMRQSQHWNSNRDISSPSRLADLKDLYMSDGRIVHLISIFLWGDDPGIKSNLIRSHPSVSVAMSRWRLSHTGGRAHSVLSCSTGDDTALVRNKSSRGGCRHCETTQNLHYICHDTCSSYSRQVRHWW